MEYVDPTIKSTDRLIKLGASLGLLSTSLLGEGMITQAACHKLLTLRLATYSYFATQDIRRPHMLVYDLLFLSHQGLKLAERAPEIIRATGHGLMAAKLTLAGCFVGSFGYKAYNKSLSRKDIPTIGEAATAIGALTVKHLYPYLPHYRHALSAASATLSTINIFTK